MDDLERVFGLVRALPKAYHADAVRLLGRLIVHAEQEMTMTKEERAKLDELDRSRRQKMYDELREAIERRFPSGKKPPQ